MFAELFAIDLSEQQKLDADLKAIQQIKVTGNLNIAEGTTMVFINGKMKERVLDYLKGTVKILLFYFVLI